MYIRPEALQEALKDEPLSQRYPAKYTESHADWFIEQEISVRDICNELRKMYALLCGFPHENAEWNPGKKTCIDRGIDQEYNVACPHAHVVQHIFRQAQYAATLLGEGQKGNTLYQDFRKEHDCIDTMDNSCRPLYQITIDGTFGGERDAQLVENDKKKLAAKSVCTDVRKGEGERLREGLGVKQGEHAEQILQLRDQFLELLGA